jgi:histidine phosphotransferase ChpT
MDRFTSILARDDDGQASVAPSRRGVVISGVAATRLSALLCARLCHELSGPIAAINNGVELLADEDPDFAHVTVELVGASARQASERLQFYRFAYGFAGGGAVAGARPRELSSRFFDGSRIACEYGESVAILPLDWQKLACNLLLVGAEALPRGGRLVLAAATLELEALGEAAVLSSETVAALTLVTPVDALSSRTVQAYFTGLLAASLGCRLVGSAEPRRARLAAVALAD